jgi:hypothetical protein
MTTTVRLKAKFRGRQVVRKAVPQAEPQAVAPGRIPRVTRLLALAHRFEKLIRDGEVRDYADLARLGHVTRARVSQIMDLLLLAPDIQEEILAMPAVVAGDDPVCERQVRGIVGVPDWGKQRRVWTLRRSSRSRQPPCTKEKAVRGFGPKRP